MGHEVRLLVRRLARLRRSARRSTASRCIASGTRHSFPFFAHRFYKKTLTGWADVLVEDVNKIPLYTPRWGANRDHRAGAASVRLDGVSGAGRAAGRRGLDRRASARSRVSRDIPFEAISESTADDLAGRGIPRRSVEVIYPGIDTVAYTPDSPSASPAPVFSYLGRLKKYKGVHLCIEAFAAMGRETRCSRSPAPATIGRTSRRSRGRLTSATACDFLGASRKRRSLSLLRRSWALVFASPKEGWGITNLEAAACATPVVASNSPGIRESVRDGKTGFLVPHGDIAAMGAAMRASRRDAGACSASWAFEARKFAEGFTWENAASQTERHLMRIVARRRRPDAAEAHRRPSASSE